VIRAFLAVSPEANVVDLYRRARDEGTQRLRGLRWVLPESLHVTLRFLGDVDEVAAHHLQGSVEAVVAPFRPFRVALGGPFCFGRRSAPRAVGFEIADGATELARLAGEVDAATRRAGFRGEDRPWTAHLTLARGRPGGAVRGWEELLAASGLTGLGFDVTDVTLYSSKLSPGGAKHAPIWSAPLRGTPLSPS